MALVSLGFHAIKNICGRRENWRLKVKLVRCWNMRAVATLDDPYAMKMLFVDEESDTIEATVQKHYMHKFANHVVEVQVYKITNFTVNRNGGKFRACSHDYKLSFSASTRVVLCERSVIPFMGLSLLKSNEIKDTRGFSHKLFDFMGIVISVSEEMKLTREGMDTRLMLVDLVDEMGQIRCAIFGDFVGEVGIQNLINASKLLWNPDIPEAVSFKESLAVHEVESDVAISVVPEKYRPDGDFIMLGTITEVLESGTWWYLACTCMRAVKFDGGPPYYDECQMEVYDMSPRYRVKLVVSDGFESVPLILFDSKYYYLLQRHCKDLLAEHKLKFSPAFSKLDQLEGKSCVIDLSPQCNSVGSEVSPTPPSFGQCSTSNGSLILASKCGSEEAVDPPCDKQKRTRLRSVKLERG
ncbi:Nucleic acid-binding, OB-fold [Sesbania bispinosa]|nr:Nucleic acid-binding, OB-fold [Sesbania bispinosa]